MKYINLFPTVISSIILKDISDNEIKKYKEILAKEPWWISNNRNGHSTDNQDILDLPVFLKLKNNILNLSKKYLKNLGFKDHDCKICNSWANLVNSNEEIFGHEHVNSFLSGVFYLSPTNSNIYFKNPIDDQWLFRVQKTSKQISKPQTWEEYCITPKQNQLLLFPSWLIHKVGKSEIDKRLSIAFNIIPTGLIGTPTAFIKL